MVHVSLKPKHNTERLQNNINNTMGGMDIYTLSASNHLITYKQ